MREVLAAAELLFWILIGGLIASCIYALFVMPSLGGGGGGGGGAMSSPPPPSEVPKAKDETPCTN